MKTGIWLLTVVGLAAGVHAAPGEVLRASGEAGFEALLRGGVVPAAVPVPGSGVMLPAASGPLACVQAAGEATRYPSLLCAGAASAVPAECFTPAKGLTNYPALLCSGATSNVPVECYQQAKGSSENPALLCSPNGALRAVLRHDVHPTYELPYPYRFPHAYPFDFPFPDPTRDPRQPRDPNRP